MHGRRKDRATITDETSAQAGAATIHRSSGETQGEWVAALPRKGGVRFGFVIMTRPAILSAKGLTEKARCFPEAQSAGSSGACIQGDHAQLKRSRVQHAVHHE